MIHVRTPSRLHFGLLNPSATSGIPCGGVGVMVERPGIELSIEPASHWSLEGPLAERVESILTRLKEQLRERLPESRRVIIHHAAPHHKGLGTGTQVALALLAGLAEDFSWKDLSLHELARLAERGKRSHVGISGFAHGGLIIDDRFQQEVTSSSSPRRVAVPGEWRFVLIIPADQHGLYDRLETEAFQKVNWDSAKTQTLLRFAKGLKAAAASRDFVKFSVFLYAFNRLAGTAFYQGGTDYASAATAELVESLRTKFGVAGAGQSSWGPTVFALTPDPDRAEWLAHQLDSRYSFAAGEIIITAADNLGARIWKT